MTIIRDEYRSAVWAEDGARRAWDLARSSTCGVRHIVADRIVSRPELAEFLVEKFEIGAKLAFESRHDRKTPHLGRVALATKFEDPPLRSVVTRE